MQSNKGQNRPFFYCRRNAKSSTSFCHVITIVGDNSSIVVICSQLDIILSACALGNGSKCGKNKFCLSRRAKCHIDSQNDF